MVVNFLKGLLAGDWGKALDFLSPEFFAVVPTWQMSRLVATLGRNYTNAALLQESRTYWQERWARWEPSPEPAQLGRLLLNLYFANIGTTRPCFLDLRAGGFRADGTGVLWQPRPWIFDFSEEFRTALGKMYAGFYTGQTTIFREGLDALDLGHSEALFIALFGNVKDGGMSFRLRDFHHSFHQIFLACRQHKTVLHPEFLPLGLMLYSLYEHAEQLNVNLFPGQAWSETNN